MKRSLALIAVLTLIVSMFSGVVFADGPVACDLDIDQDSIIYTENFDTAKITGRILDASSNALRKVGNTINIYLDADNDGELSDTEDDTILYTTEASDGEFEFTIVRGAHDVANMIIKAEDNTEATFTDETIKMFRIIKEMEIDPENTFDFVYPVDSSVTIKANYTNEDGVTGDTVEIAYVNENGIKGDVIASANYKGTESVGFLFDGEKFDHVGEIGLFINNVLTLSGEVTAPELNVEITDSVPHSLGSQDIKFNFDISTDYINGNGLQTGYELNYYIVDADDNFVEYSGDENDPSLTLVNDSGSDFNDTDEQEVTVSIDFDGWEAGDYTVVIKLEKVGTTVVAEIEKELEVVNPSHYTLMGWTLDDTLGNGTITIQFPDNPDEDSDEAPNFNSPSAGNANEQLDVREFVGGSIKYVKYFEVEVSGCGLDQTFANFGDNLVDADSNDALVAEISPETTGTLTLVIKAYKEVDGSPVDTFTKEISITGWNMEISNNSVLVDSEEDVVFTITDENGNPVNNAIIKSGTTILVDGTSTNIVGGVYTYEDDSEDLFETVQILPITVENNSGDTKINKTNGIDVIGEELYVVTSDTDVMLNGIEETIYISILDDNGDVVYPTFTRLDVDSEGDETVNTSLSIGSRKDLDNDGVKEAIAITIEPTNDQDAIILRASTDNGKKMGQVTIDVQKPQVVMTGAEKLTENFTVDFEFTVVDPRDNSVLENDIEITETSDYIEDGKLTFLTDLSSDDDVWTAEVQVIDIDWTQAEEDENTVELDIMMDEVKLATIEVAKASLTSDPETVIINAATNITLTYVDGNGNALEGYAVTLDGEEVGTTDENGQVVYATSSTSSLSLKFEADTDVEDKVTELTVKSAADTEGPVVEAPETVTEDSAVIIIKDNVRVSKVMVNGTPVEIYFPKAEVSYIASNLKMGDNTFTVETIDINNNYTKQVVVIKREASNDVVEFQVGVASEYGTPVLIEGTTMVPVRFAEKLGAVIAWDNTTKTATYTLGEKSISITIGSKTAVVNGENVQVTQTPFINSQNRTMVPLRMIAQELGFRVHWVSNDQPIKIMK